MSKHWQKGFTLVELMVAMAIGTIIILGAGQLFLTTFQTFRTVEELSRKQETVIFAANTLVNAYRSGNAGYTLEATEDSDGNELDECSIIDTQSQARPQPIVGGLATFGDECNTDRFFSPDENISGYYTFTLDFKRGGEELEILEFHVMDRNTATGGSDPNEYQVSTGDAIIAGGALSGVGSDLVQL